MGNIKKIAIIGGGITGLTTAFYLQKLKREQNLAIEITLFEQKDVLGGKIDTLYKDGFIIERGPDSYLSRKEAMTKLINEVGLADDLVRNETGQAYILNENKLHKIPEGAVMGIPTKMSPFITTDLFSPLGKARAALDLIKQKSSGQEDQSLGDFFRYRLGDEVVENLIEPLLSGIYAGDIDKLSLMATFPQFYQVEQKYRSLILGMKKTTPKSPKGKKKPGIFFTLKNGLSSLVKAMEEQLTDVEIVKGLTIDSVTRQHEGYTVETKEGQSSLFDSVVMTTPHFITAKLLKGAERISSKDTRIPTTSVANVALAYPKSAVSLDKEGTGFVVSRNEEGVRITACTWTYRKWPHTTKEDYVLLRCYVGRPDDQEIVDKSDEEIINVVKKDLQKTMGINAEPEFTIVTRWKQAMQQYEVGHLAKREMIENELQEKFPGVFIVGASYDGVGLPDCVRQGEAIVKDVYRYLL
jgi:protoporphyrinogen/coproporphyrinogen III oxidase